MATQLEQFAKLFTDLEDQVVKLDKRHSELNSIVTSLEGRQTFLKAEITKLEEMRDKALKAQSDIDKKAEAKQAKAEQSIVEIERVGAITRQNYETKNGELAKKLDELNTQLGNVNTEILARQQVIKDLRIEKDDLAKMIVDLEQTCINKKAEISQLDVDLEKGKAEVADKLFVVKNQLADAEKELTAKLVEVDDASDDLAIVSQKTKDTQKALSMAQDKYEQLAKDADKRSKALDAREASLAEQERQLEVRIITSRRRTTVLDKKG